MPIQNYYIDDSTESTAIDVPTMYSQNDEDSAWYVNNVYLPYRDSGMEAASQDPDHPLSGIPDAFARGFYRLGQGANALQVQLGLDNPQNAAREIKEYQKYIEQVPYDKEVLDSLNNIVEAESIGEIWDEVTTMPGLRAVGNVVAESLAQMSPAFAAMIGSLIFAPSAIAIGAIAGLGSLNVEVQASLLEEMQKYLNENGEDISDDKAVTKLLGDEDRMAEFSEHAAKRGIPIGLIDGLSVGFAGKIAASLSKSRRTANKALEAARKKEAKATKTKLEDMPEITPKSKIPERLAFTAEALALQPFAGGLGEAVAQQVSGEGFKLGPVALEFIAEIPGGTAETGIGLALANRRENKILELEETEKKLKSKILNERKKAKANTQLTILEQDLAGARDTDNILYMESYEDALYDSVDDIKAGEVAFTRGTIKKLFGLKSGRAVDLIIEYFVNRGTVVKSKGKYNWEAKARKQRNLLKNRQIKRNENQLKAYLEGRPKGPQAPVVPVVETTEEVTEARLEPTEPVTVKATEDIKEEVPSEFKATEVEEEVIPEAPTPVEEKIKVNSRTPDGAIIDYTYKGYTIEKNPEGPKDAPWQLIPPGETNISDVARTRGELIELIDKYEMTETTPTVDTTEIDTQLQEIQSRELRARNRLNQLSQEETSIENEEAMLEVEAVIEDIVTEKEQAVAKKKQFEATMFRPKATVDEPPEEVTAEVSEEFKSYVPTEEDQDISIIKDFEVTMDNEEATFTEADTDFNSIKGFSPKGTLNVEESTLNNSTKELVNELMERMPTKDKKKHKPFTIRDVDDRSLGLDENQNVELLKTLQKAMNTGTYLDLNVTEQERLHRMFKDEEEFVDGIIIDITAATTPRERKQIADLIKKRWENQGKGKMLWKTLGSLHSSFYKVYHPLRIADLHPIYRSFGRSILRRRQKRQLYDSTGFKLVEGFMKNTPPEQVAKISTASLILDALFSNRKGSVLNDKNVKETKDGGLIITIPEKLPKDSNITIDNFNVILDSLNKGKEVEVKPGSVITLTKEENDKFKQTQKAFSSMFDIVSRAYARFNLQRYKLYDGIEQTFDDTHESLREKTIESAARFIEDINKILPEDKKITMVTGKGKQKRNLRQKLTNIRKDSTLYKELRAAYNDLPKKIGTMDQEKYRRALGQASTLIMMNEQRSILIDHPYYVPRLRYGDHYFTVTKLDKTGKDTGDVVGYYTSTPAAFDVGEKAQRKRLVELRKEIKTDFPSDKYKVHDIKPREAETAKQLLDQPTLNTVRRLGEMIGYEKQFKEKKGEIYEFFQDLEDTINATGFGRYMAQRGEEVIVGYATPKNVDNFLPIALSNYIRSAADTASNLEYTRPLQHSIQQMKDAKELKLAALAQHQLDDINKEGEPGALFKTIAFHYALGGNFSSAMVNFSQPFVTTIPLLTAMTGNPRAATYEVMRGIKDAIKLMRFRDRLDSYGFDFSRKEPPHKGITQDEWNYLRYLSRKGDIQANVNLDLGARYQQGLGEILEGQRVTDKTAKMMEKTMDVSAFMFGGIEQINRISTALATYRLATKSDKNLRNFQKFSEVTMFHEGKMTPELAGEMMVYNSQFMIGKENRPELFRSGMMNVATQFMSFPLQYFGLWAKAFRVAGVDKKMGSILMGSMLMAMIAFGGMMGLPWAENLRQMLAFASRTVRGYDYDLEYGVREAMLGYLHPEMVEIILRGGLSRAIGIDVSRRMGAGEILPFTLMQGDLMAATGPFGGLMVDTAKRMHEAVKLGDYPMLISSVIPLGPRYIVEAMMGGYGEAMGYEPRAIRTTQGRVMIPGDKVTGGARVWQGLGFTPEAVAKARREKRLLNFWKTQSRTLQDYYLSNLAKLNAQLYRTDDPNETASINQEIDVLLNEVEQLNEEALKADAPQKVVNLQVKALRERTAVEVLGQIPRLQKKLRKFGPLIEDRLKEMVP